MSKHLRNYPFLTEPAENYQPLLNTNQEETMSQEPNNKQQLNKRLQELNTDTINKVCADLQQQKLQINTDKTELRFNKNGIPNLEEINRQREEIMRKKSQMLDDLKNLEQLQIGLAKKSKQSRMLEKNRLNMSHVSKDDVETLKSLKAKKKRHDQQLQRKIRQHQESVKKYQQDRRNSQQRHRLEQINRRKKVAAEKVQAFREKQVKRKVQIQKEREELTKLKEKSKLFEQVQIQAQVDKENFYKELKVQQSVKRMQRRMSHGQLKNHQATYLKKKQEEQNLRKNKRKQNEETLAQSTPKFDVIFLDGAMEQKKSRLKQQVSKWNTIVVNQQKKSIFSENVRQDAKTQLVINSKSKLFINETKKANDLERPMIYEKGNEYMKLGNSYIISKNCNKNAESLHLPSIVKQIPQAKQQTKQNYVVNYLKEKRLKRKRIDSHTKLENCLKQGKIQKAINFVGALQGKSHTRGEQWKTAMAKIRVLQELKNRDTL